MDESDDTKFMLRCLELASKAEGMTYPNPLVGSVLVCRGKIIGEGYHLKAGLPHAEVNAINSVVDKAKIKESTLYVNLEPCSHFGKTPPCVDLIISSAIPRVVAGTMDTSDKVSGRGIDILRNAGIDVKTGVLEEECRRLNRRFFTFNEKYRPYITLKWAESADRYIDRLRPEGHEIKPAWISGKPERILVHKWRASEQAILVGAGTLRMDDPMLNVRLWKGNDPLKIVLSGSGTFEKNPAANTADESLVVFTHDLEVALPGTIMVRLDKERLSSQQILNWLYLKGIQSLFIEGGANVINHFISNGLWDEARVFRGRSYFNQGVKAPDIKGRLISRKVFYGSTLDVYVNQ
jgi:diaminohydroxyphosphoribosylaminopyrimidine deaminase / 5-amino-6-(5-phosphoribosylamino)uracil reductase